MKLDLYNQEWLLHLMSKSSGCWCCRHRCGSVVGVYSAPVKPSVRRWYHCQSWRLISPSLSGQCPVTWDSWSPSTSCWLSIAHLTSMESCLPPSRDDVTVTSLLSYVLRRLPVIRARLSSQRWWSSERWRWHRRVRGYDPAKTWLCGPLR